VKQTQSFKHTADSVTRARHFVKEALRDAPVEVRDAVALMVSELASNCIRHTTGGFDLTITQASDQIRVEATDCGDGEPRMRTPGPTDPSGRGLRIIDMFSTAWGYERRPGRDKTVWFSLSLDAANAA